MSGVEDELPKEAFQLELNLQKLFPAFVGSFQAAAECFGMTTMI